MTPREAIRTATNSDIYRGAAALLITVAVGLGAWNLQRTDQNALEIERVRTEAAVERIAIGERLARIEANTEALLRRASE